MSDLYIFIDESGNFDFTLKGSRYFILCAVVTEDPIQGADALLRWRHHILAGGAGAAGAQPIQKPRDCTHFHCAEDDQYTRNGVFAVVSKLTFEAYATILQKNKTNPAIRLEDVFYQRVFKGLVPFIMRRYGVGHTVHLFVSAIELKSKRSAVIAALKTVLNAEKGVGSYYLHFHPNHSHHLLQVSDYVCWAIARKWERGDTKSFALIAGQVQAEFDMFSRGTTTYY